MDMYGYFVGQAIDAVNNGTYGVLPYTKLRLAVYAEGSIISKQQSEQEAAAATLIDQMLADSVAANAPLAG